MNIRIAVFTTCLALSLGGTLCAKPPALDEFWRQWQRQQIDFQSSKKYLRFIGSYAQTWKPSIIPAMIHDAATCDPNQSEVRTMVYSAIVLYMPDRKACKAIIARKLASSDPNTHKIASDFEADIEDVEAGREKLPDLAGLSDPYRP